MLEDGPLIDVLVKLTRVRQASDLTKELKGKARVDIADFQVGPSFWISCLIWTLIHITIAIQLNCTKVKLSHNGSRVRLKGFSTKSSRDLKFEVKETEGAPARWLSVQEYYKERYGVTLNHPDLPCVLSRNGAAFPMELCT